MKKSIKIGLLCLVALGAFAWIYYGEADGSYNKTSISISKDGSEVLISRLTTREEIERITDQFKSVGVAFKVKDATYSNNKLSSINFDIETPNGDKGNYVSRSMTITREFKIIINSEPDAAFI